MNKNERVPENESVKIIIFILLSYVVPIVGIGFSIYILNNSKMKEYSSWVKTLAMLSLGIQLLLILFAVVGWLMWVTI